MPAEEAYARAYDLLARVGLADRADAYPASMSGGEQRRVAIARALINSPALLLADEPTSDLDEDTEADIIDLLEQLQRTESFGFVLVTHDLALAKRAQRSYEMRQGALDGDRPAAGPWSSRHAGGASVRPRSRPSRRRPAAARAHPPGRQSVARRADLPDGRSRDPRRRPAGQLRGREIPGDAGARARGADRGLAAHGAQQPARRRPVGHRPRRRPLRIDDLSAERRRRPPIYVMSPDMRAYVQVRTTWQEVPMTPVDDSASGVLKIEGKQTYRYVFDARVRDFAQLLPNYMHVRFSGTHAGQPEQHAEGRRVRAQGQLLRLPEAVRRRRRGRCCERMRFSGKPPVWIPDAAALRQRCGGIAERAVSTRDEHRRAMMVAGRGKRRSWAMSDGRKPKLKEAARMRVFPNMKLEVQREPSDAPDGRSVPSRSTSSARRR